MENLQFINTTMSIKTFLGLTGNTKIGETSSSEFSVEGGAPSFDQVPFRVAAGKNPNLNSFSIALRQNNGKCAVTGSEIEPLLEAAHIVPYQGNNTNHITNGILLRSNIHTLFDLGLLGVNSSYEVVVCATLKDTEYYSYHGKRVRLPSEKREWPSILALKTRPLPR